MADYVELLASMDAVFVQSALREDALAPAPKKPKKIFFSDPSVFHSVRSWLKPVADPFAEQVRAAVGDPEWAVRLAEACVAAHFRRYFPTYYLKAEGEVDVAFVHGGRFWPVEVKWTGQTRPKDLKQIRKYRNGVVWARTRKRGELEGVAVEPLPLALARLTGEDVLQCWPERKQWFLGGFTFKPFERLAFIASSERIGLC